MIDISCSNTSHEFDWWQSLAFPLRQSLESIDTMETMPYSPDFGVPGLDESHLLLVLQSWWVWNGYQAFELKTAKSTHSGFHLKKNTFHVFSLCVCDLRKNSGGLGVPELPPDIIEESQECQESEDITDDEAIKSIC